MKRLAAMSAAALAFAIPPALAEPGRAPSTVRLEALVHFGVATMPFDVTTLREAKGHAFVFLASGSYALSEQLSFELRAPLVLGSVAQPAASYVDASALGNLQLGLRARLLRRTWERSELSLSAAGDLGAPLASHDDDLMPNRLLAIADGIEGRGHPEYFTPGVIPLTPATLLRWTTADWRLDAELRLPLFARVSEASLPEAKANPKPVGLASVVGVGARYRLSQRFSLAASAHLALDLIPVAERVPGASRAQDFERLSLDVHFGSRAALALDLQTAIAGDLGGNTVAGGLRFGLDF